LDRRFKVLVVEGNFTKSAVSDGWIVYLALSSVALFAFFLGFNTKDGDSANGVLLLLQDAEERRRGINVDFLWFFVFPCYLLVVDAEVVDVVSDNKTQKDKRVDKKEQREEIRRSKRRRGWLESAYSLSVSQGA
jgi:hypothetical protein